MKISIITPTYNSARTILEALNSVALQTYTNIEHIIIDGASTDGTVNLVNNYIMNYQAFGVQYPVSINKLEESNVSRGGVFADKYPISSTRIFSEPDSGIYDALNKGITKSTGEIIGLLHSDDFYAHRSVIEKVVRKFIEGYDIVYGGLQYLSKKNNNKVIRSWYPGKYRTLRFGWMPPHPSLFIKKDIIDRIGKYDTQFKIASDYDFVFKIFQYKLLKIFYIEEILVKMRAGGISNKSLKSIVRKSYEDYQVLKKNNFNFSFFTLLSKNIRKLPQFFNL